MIAALLTLALMAQTPAEPVTPAAAPTGKRRVLVLDMKAQAVDPATVQTISEIVANAFARDKSLAVTSGADVRAVLDVEANKRSLDCGEAQSCLAELAGALGAELVVTGSVGRLGDLLVVTISLYDAVAQASAAKAKVEDADLAKLSPKIDAAVDDMLGHSGSSGGGSPLVIIGAITAGVGVAALGIGGGVGAYSYGVQTDRTTTGVEKDQAASIYAPALVACGVGALATIAGAAILVVGLAE